MSSGTNLQEMEVGTQVSKTAVNANAAPAQALPKAGSNASNVSTPGNQAQVEDLGGPTPDNYSPTNDSAKLKPAGGSLKQVRDVVNKGAAPAEAAGTSATPVKVPEEVEATDEVVSEAPAEESETVSEVQEIDIDLSDDVKALFEGEELSESFQEKAKTIFEATIKSKIAAVKESLEAQYQTQIDKDVAEWKSALQERVDDYLHYVAEEWITENALQVESGIRGELSESFMTGLKGLFEEHYVNIPEEKYDVLEAMVTKLDEMENKLNEQIDSNVALTKRLSVSVSDNILDEVSEGLALSQKEKLAELAKGVEFESEEQYRVQLNTLKESYFTKKPVAESQEVISEDAPVVEHSPAMEAYLQAVTKFQ